MNAVHAVTGQAIFGCVMARGQFRSLNEREQQEEESRKHNEGSRNRPASGHQSLESWKRAMEQQLPHLTTDVFQ